MNELERRLATLLRDAPGEPPIMLDSAALMPAGVPRRRYVPRLVAAAAVLAVAVPAAVLVDRGSSAPSPSSRQMAGPTAPEPADPRQAAIRTAETILATAPVPSGARRADSPPMAALKRPSEIPGAQHVLRTRFWTAPGTVTATISYLNWHPPAGMRKSGSGTSSGPGMRPNQSIDFHADTVRSLQYVVVAYRGGVAIRADAVVLWAPRRVRADSIPVSVTAVDVLVVRQDPQLHQGAPTVRRTLTGAPARDLAEFVNRLPRAIPTHYTSCPAELGGERWFDRLVFHGHGPDATVLVNMVGCASTTLRVGNRRPIQLSQSYSGAVGNIDNTITTTLGLPRDYGGR